MKYELILGMRLPKVGFGTWRIGGNSSSDPRQDSASLSALRSALEIGYTHFDTAEMYADGHAEELIGLAVHESKASREGLFITSKVMPSHLKYDQILRACEASLRRLQTDYLDLYLIHWPQVGMKLSDSFRALNKLVRDGKVKHLGVSNFNIKLLEQSQKLSETAILTDQVPFSLSDRSYVKNGILEYCQQNGILMTAYSPIDEGRLAASRELDTIARARHAIPDRAGLDHITSARDRHPDVGKPKPSKGKLRGRRDRPERR